MTEPQTKAGRAVLMRRAMNNGIDLMDKAAMAVLADDILAIERQAADAVLDRLAADVEGLRADFASWGPDAMGPLDAVLALITEAQEATRRE